MQNRRGASCFNPTIMFLLLHFASLSPFHSCACCFFTVLSHSRCHFLSHAFSLAFCLAFLLIFSLIRGVLPRCPHLSLSFAVSFTPFLHFLVLVDFVWVDFRSLVLLSLSTRGMLSYLYMLEMLSGCLYHRFWVQKIFGRKNFK